MNPEPVVASEVHPAADDTYRIHAAAKFRGCVCIPKLNAINLLYLVLAITFLFLVAWSPWENRTNPQFGPWLQVTNWYLGIATSLSGTG